MNQPATPVSPPGSPAAGAIEPQPFSPAHLPLGQDPDERFQVAEEVNLDQQSDDARRVGQAPDAEASEAQAQQLTARVAEKDGDVLCQAVERAIPPSG